MQASFVARPCLKRFLILPLLIGLFQFLAFSQTRLDDVHISQRSAAAVRSIKSAGLEVIKKEVNLVLVPVSVVDRMQRIVVGLQRENFQVFEGRKPQVIQHFSTEDAPVSVGIILDTSGSMHDKMDRVREAVHQFCDTSNINDEFFMITFSDAPRLASDFTQTPAEIEKELVYTYPKGRTALLDAIYMGLRKMKDAKYSRKALLVISDGGDNHSRYTERDIREAVRESDVAIYAIGTFDRYMPTEEELLGPSLLSSITEPTGGEAFTITNPNEMPDAAKLIGTQLRTEYVLGYRPEDVPLDGKWHKINVKLRIPRKLPYMRAHARSGYYAAAE